MSFPRKARGWRSITVEEQRFRWRFTSSRKGILTLQGPLSSGRQVVVALRDWHDIWLFFRQSDLAPNRPARITARLARQAILFALAHGWEPSRSGPPLRVNLRDGALALAMSESDSAVHERA